MLKSACAKNCLSVGITTKYPTRASEQGELQIGPPVLGALSSVLVHALELRLKGPFTPTATGDELLVHLDFGSFPGPPTRPPGLAALPTGTKH